MPDWIYMKGRQCSHAFNMISWSCDFCSHVTSVNNMEVMLSLCKWNGEIKSISRVQGPYLDCSQICVINIRRFSRLYTHNMKSNINIYSLWLLILCNVIAWAQYEQLINLDTGQTVIPLFEFFFVMVDDKDNINCFFGLVK